MRKNVLHNYILDIDECTSGSHNCHADATCHNNTGSFYCICNTGYTGTGTVCEGLSISHMCGNKLYATRIDLWRNEKLVDVEMPWVVYNPSCELFCCQEGYMRVTYIGRINKLYCYVKINILFSFAKRFPLNPSVKFCLDGYMNHQLNVIFRYQWMWGWYRQLPRQRYMWEHNWLIWLHLQRRFFWKWWILPGYVWWF